MFIIIHIPLPLLLPLFIYPIFGLVRPLGAVTSAQWPLSPVAGGHSTSASTREPRLPLIRHTS